MSALLAIELEASEASAYCHKSTCNPEKEECEKDEYDCVSSGRGMAWTSLPIPYRFHAAGSEHFRSKDLRAAVKRAFKTWETVECENGEVTSLHFKQGADIEEDPERGAAAPLDFGIYFRDEAWPEAASDIALSRVTARTKSGTIAGANIEVNTAQKTFRLQEDDEGEFDLEAVMIHEVGHYLGLDHSSDQDSIMVADYCNGEKPCTKSTDILRALGADDVAAVCRLYPPAPTDTSSCTASAIKRSPSTTNAPLWSVPAVAALIAIRLLRRRRQKAT